MTRVGEFDVNRTELPGGGSVLRVEGELDMATAPALEDALAQAGFAERLVVDLTTCTFVDSSAVRVLVSSARDSAAAGGTLALVVTDPGILRVIEISGVVDDAPGPPRSGRRTLGAPILRCHDRGASSRVGSTPSTRSRSVISRRRRTSARGAASRSGLLVARRRFMPPTRTPSTVESRKDTSEVDDDRRGLAVDGRVQPLTQLRRRMEVGVAVERQHDHVPTPRLLVDAEVVCAGRDERPHMIVRSPSTGASNTDVVEDHPVPCRPCEGGQLPACREALDVPPEEDLDVHPASLSSLARLPPLAARVRRAHDRALDVEIELGEEEVWRKGLSHRAVRRALEHEGVRLVEPRDSELVEDTCDLSLDRVRKGRREIGVGTGWERSLTGPGCPAARLSKQPRRTFRILSARTMPPLELEQHETDDPNVLHVGVSGELDLTNARELEDRIDELSAANASALVLDLNRVVFIDSAALRPVQDGAPAPHRHRPGADGPIARTVEIVGLAEATVLGDSVDAVLDALASL